MDVFLIVELDSTRIAFRASVVARVLHAVAITPLPGAPACTLGVLNVHGTVVPVLDLRARLGLPDRKLSLTDHIVLLRTGARTVAIIADRCDGMVERDADAAVPPEAVLPGIRQVAGIVADRDGVLFVHDIDAFLSLSEARALDAALAGADDS